jgi:DNA-binding NarL/FixJ family response regulator
MSDDFSEAQSGEVDELVPAWLAIVDHDITRSRAVASSLRLPMDDLDYFIDSYSFLADPQLFQYRVYLISIDMEDLSALELVKILRLRSSASVVLLTHNDDAATLAQAEAAGASALINISQGLHLLPEQLQAVYARRMDTLDGAAPWSTRVARPQAPAIGGSHSDSTTASAH